MAQQRRMFRVAERLQAVVATTVQKLSDPRLHLVTISTVKISSDLRVASVYWTVLGPKERREEVNEGFEAATGLLRSAVAKGLGVRTAPELRFFYDDTFDVLEEVDTLFKRLETDQEVAEDQREEDG